MWVEVHLESWLRRHIDEENTCVALNTLIKAYHQEARVTYQGNPEAISVMVLTIIDLWIACDKAACRLYELLKLYDHEIAPSLLWSLLLPLKSQLSRISNIESYLQSRANQIQKDFVSPFRDFGHRSSFAVRYFDQSPQHQQLLIKIEEEAQQRKDDKARELAKLNQSHRDLMHLYESCSCEYVQVTQYDADGSPYEETQHTPQCKKCAYHRQAKNMTITLNEWPISREPNIAKATIFELTVPPAYGAWRDITHYTLQTVLGYKYEAEKRPWVQTTPSIEILASQNIIKRDLNGLGSDLTQSPVLQPIETLFRFRQPRHLSV